MNNFTPRANQVLAFASKQAEQLGNRPLDTEHLLLGIFDLNKGVVVHVLRTLGLDTDALRNEMRKALSSPEHNPTGEAGEQTPRFKKVLTIAHEEAKRMGHSYTGTEHIFLGLLREDTGLAALVLKSCDVDLEEARCEVLKELDPGARARFSEAIHDIRLHGVEQELKQMRQDISKKLEKVVELFESLKTEITQLRTDKLKGNS